MSRFAALGAALPAACGMGRIETAMLGCVAVDEPAPCCFVYDRGKNGDNNKVGDASTTDGNGGVCDGGSGFNNSAGCGDDAGCSNGDALPPMPLLCGTKLLTSLLVLQACARFALPLDQPLAHALPAPLRQDLPAALLPVTLEQLLAHTHGLGGTQLERAHFTHDERIDLTPVSAALQQEGARHPPGRHYGYGVAGYLVLGWLLERLYGRRYGDIVHEHLLTPIAASTLPPLPAPCRICPASGLGLKLPLPWVMALCQHLLRQESGTVGLYYGLFRQIMRHRAPLPGWSMQIEASCLGWRHVGGQWYGHNGLDGAWLFWLRLNPARGLAFCLLGRAGGGNPGLLPACLFSSDYPALVLNPAHWPAIDPAFQVRANPDLIGVYGSPCREYRVFEQEGHLGVEIACIGDGDALVAVHRSWLYPARGRLFYLARPWRRVVFLQFVEDGVWDHDYVWGRVPPGWSKVAPATR